MYNFKIKIFADGADINDMLKAYKTGIVQGFTTNPTLMKKSGITNYEDFAKKVLKEIKDMPISFEVFSDNFTSMEKEARVIASWADNVVIKIPVTNTKGESSADLIKKLSSDGLNLNITAVFTLEQVEEIKNSLSDNGNHIISVFAGRIADSGIDPIPHMKKCVEIIRYKKNIELLWASPREVLNVIQAEESGCHIITIMPDILNKFSSLGKSLKDFSLDTVKMFYNDAVSSGFKII